MTTTSSDRSAAAPSSIWGTQFRATTIGLLTLVTMIAFEATAVATALPTAARDLHDLAAFGWAFSGFLVAEVVGLVVSAMLCTTGGPRPSLVGGVGLFVAGLVLAGSALDMPMLVAGRVVQGLGAGLLGTAIYVVIGTLYPARLRGPVFAGMSSAWVLPGLLGPVIAGSLAQHASWRLVFLGLVPLVGVGALLLVPVLRTMHGRGARITHPRRLVSALAVALGVAALEQTGQHPSLHLIVLAVLGLAALAWGVRALVPRGTLLVRPGVGAPVALRGLLAGAFFGVESVVPLSLAEQHGYGATLAGLPLAGTAISWAFGSWVQSRVDDDARGGPARRRLLVRIGFTCVTVAAAGMAVVAVPAVPGWLVFVVWLPAGLGAGLTMSSVGVLLLRFTTEADRGADSAALQLSDVTTSAITTGVAGVLVAAATHGHIGSTAAFVTIDVIMSGLAFVGVLTAHRLRPGVGARP